MKTVQRLLPLITLIILVAALWIATPYLLATTNLSPVVRQTLEIVQRLLPFITPLVLGAAVLIVKPYISGAINLSQAGKTVQRLLPFITLIILVTALSIATPHFLTATNLSSVVRQTAVFNIMALGMTLIIISSGVDLSVGSILAMGGLMGTMAMSKGQPILVGVVVGVLTGGVFGLINGLAITRLNISPFIVTLGTMGIVRGLALVVSGGLPVHEIPKGFSYLGEGTVAGVPFVLLLLVACALLVHFLLDRTRLGRYTFAIGSNVDAAIYAGIPVKFHTTAIYAIGGLLTGLAGMIEASRLMTGQPTAGQGYELQAIAAVVIGGGSLRGGEGSVTGTLIGEFIMGLLSNGCDLLGINPYWQQVIIGAVIILAVSVDELRKRRPA